MAISDKLTYLNTTKTKIREGLNSLGADLDTEDTFRSYADAIEGIYEDYPKITGEGESLSLDNTKQASMQIDYKGQTSQTGTPTPSSPIPINVVSGDNTINICGKNLFNLTNIQNNGTGRTSFIVNDNDIMMTATTGGTYRYIYKQIDNLTIGQPYIIKINSYNDTSTNKLAQWGITTTGGSYYGNIQTLSNTQSLTITPTETSIQFRIGYLTNSCSANDTLTIGNIQLEKGNQATTYEPYIGHSYHITLPSGIELCKIGTYQDYIYKEDGSWYLHKEIGKSDLKDEGMVLQSINDYGIANFLVQPIETNVLDTSKIENSLCNRFSRQTTGIAQTQTEGFLRTLNAGIRQLGVYIRISSDKANTVATFKTWLENNPTYYYWALYTPTNTEITDTTLLEQLEESKLSYISQTNISQENNDLPFNLDVKALRGE